MELLGDVYVETIVTGFGFDCFGDRIFIFILSHNFAAGQRKLDCKKAYRKNVFFGSVIMEMYILYTKKKEFPKS